MSQHIQLCPNCGAPLIFTFAFSGCEYYCLDCGHQCGLFLAFSAETTPELDARRDTLKAEWDEHVRAKLIAAGGYRLDCHKCEPHREPHRAHATQAELEAHQEAVDWLNARRFPSRSARA